MEQHSNLTWPLPKDDYWSTPFAETLLHRLDLSPGISVLDIACGSGIPAFYIAEQVGPSGQVVALDINIRQITRCRAFQRNHLPWLQFKCADMKNLPETLPQFDRISGNLSFMFFRPDRFDVLKQLVTHLKPGGQIVLTFPSLGTFDSIWNRIDQEMTARDLTKERAALAEYIAERPSAQDAREWLDALGMAKIEVTEWPLEIESGSGYEFLHHPLLRGGFLDDAYECFENQRLAEDVMTTVSGDLSSFLPLVAQRCAMSAWMPSTGS
ncbi:MAG TPA: class I SAM-dependent methyltransferase [Nitrospirales bacterium]|nr:class I SAM-dependent methyltransferase [Nitrospirales bacterium]HIN32684.1 class I SAM-dependent methyltransferase [Nitrospirales bacterium]HIO20963.1 class I SAM-dependent methyltransferase [Nitrospirales bacterium]